MTQGEAGHVFFLGGRSRVYSRILKIKKVHTVVSTLDTSLQYVLLLLILVRTVLPPIDKRLGAVLAPARDL